MFSRTIGSVDRPGIETTSLNTTTPTQRPQSAPRSNLLGGLLILLGCQWLGELLKAVTGAPLPGPVIGMLLLLTFLIARGDVPAWLGETSQSIIRILSLLFLPPAVGLFFLGPHFASQWPAVIGAVIVGTLITLVVTAALMNSLLRRRDRGSHGP